MIYYLVKDSSSKINYIFIVYLFLGISRPRAGDVQGRQEASAVLARTTSLCSVRQGREPENHGCIRLKGTRVWSYGP